ncbi:hypothetical protein EVAR_18154_1 [Eumeta japonica]|uniref:Uncharacterized protein n=1 Tax=Eumeta variegata TaxID=151549 RepID=A0A4C1UV93_EUMVA|nr:hypothetical protein EVAR_18154_1 [Eumeta japonica]
MSTLARYGSPCSHRLTIAVLVQFIIVYKRDTISGDGRNDRPAFYRFVDSRKCAAGQYRSARAHDDSAARDAPVTRIKVSQH